MEKTFKTITLNKFTREQAVEYANNEADIRGFAKNSSKWQKAFNDYIAFAIPTMSVGRNPRSFRYKLNTVLYEDVFGEKGFAGTVAKNYKTNTSNERGVPLSEIQSRILSSVMNLTKLFENGIMGVRNIGADKEGKVESKEMSELQFPNKEDFSSEEEYEKVAKEVARKWIQRDLITNIIVESLMPFFTASKEDVDEILSSIEIDKADVKQIMGGRRADFTKRLRAVVKPKLAKLSYRDLILKNL